MPSPVLFDEADLESERLGESDARCSYPPPAPESAISELRSDEPASGERITLRAPPPSSALLELSGIEPVLGVDASRENAARSHERDEPLRETREPFRRMVRDTWPENRLPTLSRRPTAAPPEDIDEALRRAARTSFSSITPEVTDRQSGVRISAPHTIEEAVLRVIEAAEPFETKLPKA